MKSGSRQLAEKRPLLTLARLNRTRSPPDAVVFTHPLACVLAIPRLWPRGPEAPFGGSGQFDPSETGLRLERGRAPVEMCRIESVARPSEN